MVEQFEIQWFYEDNWFDTTIYGREQMVHRVTALLADGAEELTVWLEDGER